MPLHVRALRIHRTDGVHLLGPLDLDLYPGERVALVGESGSGKSLLAQALLGILPPGVLGTGRVQVRGVDMARPGRARDALRGPHLAWVPQDPLSALTPWMTLGEHLALLPGLHRGESPTVALARLALAVALSCDPEFLILDEPTSALDPAAQEAFLALVLGLQADRGLGFLWITHDLGLAGKAADRALVLYGGEPLEAGPTGRLWATPRHPYTRRLVQASRLEPSPEAGFLPAPGLRPEGCPFAPRCPEAQTSCARWAPWRGRPEDGLRCDRTLEAPPPP